jgi:hypothetical protein
VLIDQKVNSRKKLLVSNCLIQTNKYGIVSDSETIKETNQELIRVRFVQILALRGTG